MAQIDELDLLKALRQPWAAPRQPADASHPKVPRTPVSLRQGVLARQLKPRSAAQQRSK